ncbi:MAG: hypothetical protein LBG73_01345 [Spirochaetaceae bacterium]|jgi:hypothetical protein|nr:hypothetical protein [Spirochaetaceae bacterium]
MKKLVFVLIIALSVIGMASAQNWGNGWTNPQPVTVNGTLQLQNGVIAVASGNAVYYVPTLERYIGFIDGLKEGVQINIEGFVSGNYVQPSRITINGKSYDFTANVARGNAGYGSCCWGW